MQENTTASKRISKSGEKYFESLFSSSPWNAIKTGKGSINKYLKRCKNEQILNELNNLLVSYENQNSRNGQGDYLVLNSNLNKFFSVEIKTVEDFFKSSGISQARLTHNVPIILIDLKQKRLYFISRRQIFQLAAHLDNGQHTLSLETIGISFSKFEELFGKLKNIRSENETIFSCLEEDFKDYDDCQELIEDFLKDIKKANAKLKNNVVKKFRIPKIISQHVEVIYEKNTPTTEKSLLNQLFPVSKPIILN